MASVSASKRFYTAMKDAIAQADHPDARVGTPDVIRLYEDDLLSGLIDVNHVDGTGATVLHRIALAGDYDGMLDFLRFDPAIDLVDETGDTAIIHAIIDQAGRDPDGRCVMMLIEKGAALGPYRDADGNITNSQMNALHWAAIWGRWKLFRPMVERGVDPNWQDDLGRTALHCAVANRMGADETGLLAIREILALGADPFISNNEGQLPADLALSHDVPFFQALIAERTMKDAAARKALDGHHGRLAVGL